MKKIFYFILLFIFIFIYINGKDNDDNTASLYDKYNQLKQKIEKAEELFDLAKVTSLHNDIMYVLNKLKRKDLIIWRLNNFAYFRIKYFLHKTRYQEAMDYLKVAINKEDKKLYKKQLKEECREYIPLLIAAYKDLNTAKMLDELCTKKDQNRTAKIKANLNFIENVIKFLKDEI